MNRLINLSIKLLFLVFICFFLAGITSCEEDVTNVGGDFINSLDIPEPYEVQNLTAYNEKIFSVQTNNLSTYLLGQYSDPVFGDTETSILTQLSLESYNLDFGQNPTLDSVVLTLPLFSTLVDTDEYRIDSIFGNAPFKISVFESNQFLRDLDPGEDGNFEENQIYYSDQLPEFQNNISSTQLAEDNTIHPEDLTRPTILFERVDEETTDTLSLSPRIRVKLDNSFFQDKILNNENNINLVSESNFRNFLRGLYLKLENTTNQKTMFNLNLSNPEANITLYYTSLREPSDPEETELEESFETFRLNFSGNIVNLYTDFNALDIGTQDTENGQEILYIKGGQGVATIVDPFSGPDENNNGIADEIETLKQNNWLINEANLILYLEDNFTDQLEHIPFRIFAYDIGRDRVLIDYNLDPGANSNPFISRRNHLGELEEDDEGNSFYKIRLTNHINNIIQNDSLNTKIGIVVTQDVNQTRTQSVKQNQQDELDSFIESAVSTPRGVVFHGNLSQNEVKRLKLQIYYSETN